MRNPPSQGPRPDGPSCPVDPDSSVALSRPEGPEVRCPDPRHQNAPQQDPWVASAKPGGQSSRAPRGRRAGQRPWMKTLTGEEGRGRGSKKGVGERTAGERFCGFVMHMSTGGPAQGRVGPGGTLVESRNQAIHPQQPQGSGRPGSTLSPHSRPDRYNVCNSRHAKYMAAKTSGKTGWGGPPGRCTKYRQCAPRSLLRRGRWTHSTPTIFNIKPPALCPNTPS